VAKPIPLVDLLPQYKALGKDFRSTVTKVLRGGRFIGGEEVTGFETDWSQFVGAGHAVSCGNGTDALELALTALDLRPGSLVAVPALTFVATAEAVVRTGHEPVFVDVGPDGLMSAEDLRRIAKDKHIAAAIPVHLWGQAAPIVDLREAASEAVFIEDAAQAHGARYQGSGERVGSEGGICTWSFFPGKNLGACGDAGAVTTDDSVYAEKVRRLARHGRLGKHDHDLIGTNSRMDAVQAALLRVKLAHLTEWVELRRLAAEYYREAFEREDVLGKGVSLVVDKDSSDRSAWHIFPVLVDPKKRDRFVDDLKGMGIGAGVHYPYAIPDLKAYRRWKRPLGYPMAEFLAASEISLPLFPEITQDQLDRVVESVDVVATLLQPRRSKKKGKRRKGAK